MHLQGYSFKLINEPGSSNLADYLSRFPVSEPPSRNFAEKYVCHLTANLLSAAIPESGVEYGSSEDPVICKVQHALRSGCPDKSDHELKPFCKLKHELSSYNNLLPGISNLSVLVHFGL